MVFVVFCVLLLGLSLANLLYLLEYSAWFGWLILVPVGVVAWRWSGQMEAFIYRAAQGMLGLCAVAITVLLLQKILQDLPPVVERLLPVAVAAVALYLLCLYLREHRRTESASALPTVLRGPPVLLSLAIAVVMAVYLLLVLSVGGQHFEAFSSVTVRFTERGIIPPITLIFFCWGLILLLVKRVLLAAKLREPKGDKRGNYDGGLRADELDAEVGRAPNTRQAETYINTLWHNSNEFYLIPKYINWSIPILGFIGTVLGISLAASGIQQVISSQQGLSDFSSGLGDAIAPLGIAFDTTLIALSLSVVLTLLQTLQQKWEDRVLIRVEKQLYARIPTHA